MQKQQQQKQQAEDDEVPSACPTPNGKHFTSKPTTTTNYSIIQSPKRNKLNSNDKEIC